MVGRNKEENAPSFGSKYSSYTFTIIPAS